MLKWGGSSFVFKIRSRASTFMKITCWNSTVFIVKSRLQSRSVAATNSKLGGLKSRFMPNNVEIFTPPPSINRAAQDTRKDTILELISCIVMFLACLLHGRLRSSSFMDGICYLLYGRLDFSIFMYLVVIPLCFN